MAFDPSPNKPGLFVRVSGGTLLLNGGQVVFSPTDVVVAPNATNYIYIDLVNQAFSANITGFPGSSFPIATVVTDSSKIITVTDQRADYTVSVA